MKKLKLKKIKIFNKKKSVTKNTKKKSNKNKIDYKHIIISGMLIGGIILTTLGLVFALYIIITAPDFNTQQLYEKEATIIYDLDGNEMVRVGKDNIDLVTYEELPQVLVDAIVATEDSRFFQHTGLDAARLVAATVGQLLGNDEAGGASTLSMQVIKNTYTSSVATGIDGLVRKAQDIYMSIFKLENSYTKEEILEFYVNSIWLGNDNNVNYTSITGVEQGSQYYFGKSVSELNLAEASLIAGMFQNPFYLNPYNYPEDARDRQETVLNLMVRHGYITENEKDAVLAIPIESILKEKEESSINYFQASVDYILAEAEDKTGLNPYTTPMKIYSTIDLDVQQILRELESGESYEIPESYGNLQFGIAITNIDDGSISAMSPGIDYVAQGSNRATIKRQPGSTAKPIFDYGPYIEYLNGSPGTYFLDEAHSYTNGTSIRNWDNKFEGIISMRDALIDSRNIPALKAFQEVNAYDSSLIPNFVESLGIDYGEALYESASIGGFMGASPIELSAAYAAFGRGGYYIEPYSITSITLIENDETIDYKYEKEKVMSEQTAYLITDILTETGGSGLSISGTQIATKTGTTTIDEEAGYPSSAIMDAWVVSYNPEYSFATWIGYDKLSKDLYLTSALSNPIRNGISKAVGYDLYSKNQTFDRPSGIISVEVEKDTFPLQLPSEYTPADMRVTELFKSGTEPTDISTRYIGLENPTDLKTTYDGVNIKLDWTSVATPDAINSEYLANYFNEYFDSHATTYYEQRINYNTSYIGTLVYDIYLDTNGTLTLLGSTDKTTYDYVPTEFGKDYKFVVKTSYSLFKASSSSGAVGTINIPGGTGSDPDTDTDTDTDTTNPDDTTTTP